MNQIRISLTLRGSPVKLLISWKHQGLVTGCKDAVVKFFQVFKQQVVEQDLKKAQLKTLSQEVDSID